jgi:hypothetical protein
MGSWVQGYSFQPIYYQRFIFIFILNRELG